MISVGFCASHHAEKIGSSSHEALARQEPPRIAILLGYCSAIFSFRVENALWWWEMHPRLDRLELRLFTNRIELP